MEFHRQMQLWSEEALLATQKTYTSIFNSLSMSKVNASTRHVEITIFLAQVNGIDTPIGAIAYLAGDTIVRHDIILLRMTDALRSRMPHTVRANVLMTVFQSSANEWESTNRFWNNGEPEVYPLERRVGRIIHEDVLTELIFVFGFNLAGTCSFPVRYVYCSIAG